MLDIEMGYKLGNYRLNWLEVEKIAEFYEIAKLQLEIYSNYGLSEAESLAVAKNVRSVSTSLGITQEEALAMIITSTATNHLQENKENYVKEN